MKTLRNLLLSWTLAAAVSGSSLATSWTVGGYVYCDANQSGQIDTNDTPLTGVLVVVTNTSGTYSNGVFTDTPDGGYIMQLPAQADSYVAYLHPLTLPSDATISSPAGGGYAFTLDNAGNFLGNFLISSSICSGTTNNPPGTNSCELKACGTILCGKKAAYTFGGQAHPGCGSTNGDSGKWEVVAHFAKLHLEGEVFDIVNCGEISDADCTRKFIEFQGIGTLKGVNGCKTNYGVVYFVVHAEDGASCNCGDRLYVRVYTPEGGTVLLISSDSSDDQNIAPVAISTGSIAIRSVSCSGGCNGEHGHEGDCEHNGGHGSNCDGEKGRKGGEGDHGKGGDCKDKDDKGGKKGGDSKNGDKDDKGGKGDQNSKGDCSSDSGKGNGKQGSANIGSTKSTKPSTTTKTTSTPTKGSTQKGK